MDQFNKNERPSLRAASRRFIKTNTVTFYSYTERIVSIWDKQYKLFFE